MKMILIMMQIKLIFTTKVSHLASFESEIFWNSEMAYFDVCRRIRLRDHSLQMKATKQDFVMVLFTVLYKVAHTFQSVDERKSSRLN